MSSDWSELRHPWQRLRWARLRWQNSTGAATTARAAAESLGMKENTYSAYERAPGAEKNTKHTALDDQRAIQFGNKFKVNWVWLLTGQQTPFAMTPAQEKAMALLADADEAEQERAVELIAVALKRRAG